MLTKISAKDLLKKLQTNNRNIGVAFNYIDDAIYSFDMSYSKREAVENMACFA